MNFYKWFDIYKLSKEQKHTHKDQMEDVWNAINEKILKIIDDSRLEAWSKMGNTGADGYWDNATKEQIWEFGRYRALEDLQHLLTELKGKIKVG